MKNKFNEAYLEMTIEEFWNCKLSEGDCKIEKDDDEVYKVETLYIYIGELSSDYLMDFSPYKDIIIWRHKGISEKFQDEHFFWVDFQGCSYVYGKEYSPTTKMSEIINEIEKNVYMHFKDILIKIKKYTSVGIEYVIDRVWNHNEFCYFLCISDDCGLEYHLDENENMHITAINKARV